MLGMIRNTSVSTSAAHEPCHPELCFDLAALISPWAAPREATADRLEVSSISRCKQSVGELSIYRVYDRVTQLLRTKGNQPLRKKASTVLATASRFISKVAPDKAIS
jgi:hypothetical protein